MFAYVGLSQNLKDLKDAYVGSSKELKELKELSLCTGNLNAIRRQIAFYAVGKGVSLGHVERN